MTLDYLEIEITHYCNLNCKGCCAFSNLAEKTVYSPEEFSRDMERMKELFSHITKIRLMGGEPLLNKDVCKYVKITKDLFPDTDLRITTNGLLIPKLKSEILLELKEAGVWFDISNYPPTRKSMPEIKKRLNEFGIGFELGIPMDFFLKTIRETPNGKADIAFRNCMFTHCHMLMNGRLYPCSYACDIKRLNENFGTSYPEDDCFDIYNSSAEEILKAFSAPHKFCNWCSLGPVPFRWKGGRKKQDAKLDDWIIKDNFMSEIIMPSVQKVAVKPAKALRSAIQKRK